MPEEHAPQRKRFESPYSTWESVKFLWKNVRLSRKNPGNIQFLPKISHLNDLHAKYTLTFIGDIMDLGGRYLELSSLLKEFIQNSDFFIGNFEGTITHEKPRGMDQRHDDKILDSLKKIFLPSKTYLNVANNHGADFGSSVFHNSLEILLNSGFNVFGTKDKPAIDINQDLRLIGCTMWINRICDYLTKIEDINATHLKKGAMNILCPHWGYDLELYPRAFVIKKANEFLREFDAIIGHHSHCPQPVTQKSNEKGSPTKLLAYSLGDFCFGKLLTKHFYNYNYGIVLKAKIGKNSEDIWAIGDVQWVFTKTILQNNEVMEVKIIETNPYFQNSPNIN